ncbi:MAG: YbaB/EbfC family nucleoid-associated protein [Clostridiales bacterium]|nr:YbaB/EbfC family nucleoid-associated protein [Clostridiales bacterium]
MMAYGNFGGFGGANMQGILRQAQKMQEDMQRAKKELDETEFTSSVGGGMVEVKMMGNKTLKSVSIKPQVVDPDDIEMLEDLVVSAVNDVLGQIARKEQDSIPQMPGGMF